MVAYIEIMFIDLSVEEAMFIEEFNSKAVMTLLDLFSKYNTYCLISFNNQLYTSLVLPVMFV